MTATRTVRKPIIPASAAPPRSATTTARGRPTPTRRTPTAMGSATPATRLRTGIQLDRAPDSSSSNMAPSRSVIDCRAYHNAVTVAGAGPGTSWDRGASRPGTMNLDQGGSDESSQDLFSRRLSRDSPGVRQQFGTGGGRHLAGERPGEREHRQPAVRDFA